MSAMDGQPTARTAGSLKKGLATADTLKIGCIVVVEKNGAPRKAEVLGIKITESGRHFYCNFDSFNKRLDEWVPASRIDFDADVEWPAAETDKSRDPKPRKTSVSVSKRTKASGRTKIGKKTQKRPGKRGSQTTRRSSTDGQARRESADDASVIEITDEMDRDENQDAAEATPHFSREVEIEKLRTSGSMTQNPAEVSRIRNISQVQFGEYELFPWYFSPYPDACSQVDMVYICEFCLGYYADRLSFGRHVKKCSLRHPPGNEIYRDDGGISFFEIDGRRQRTWCRNLCLLSKMFLDHKTLYYDVDPFLFYVMVGRAEDGCHLLGYFSKEKESADGYNVACILTLPQHQRKGYGRLLIQFSYELSRIEGKLGSPEKPLSDLGLLSYRQYWVENMLDMLVGLLEKGDKATVTVEAISTALAMTAADVEHTLHALKMQAYHKGDHKIVIPTKLLEQRDRQKMKPRRMIDPERIQWKPPTFPSYSKTWGW